MLNFVIVFSLVLFRSASSFFLTIFSNLLEYEGKSLIEFDIKFNALLTLDNKLQFTIEYSQKYQEAVIIRYADYFLSALQNSLSTNIEQTSQKKILIEHLFSLASTEKELLKIWNNTERAYPANKTIQGLFEEQVELSPDKIALVFEDTKLTFREVNESSNRFAYYLRSFISEGQLVIVHLPRGIDLIIAYLAILKVGAIIVPVDSKCPQERLNYIVNDTKSPLAISHSKFSPKFESLNCIQVVYIDLIQDKLLLESVANLALNFDSDALCFVIYTSGSTGVPKGVLSRHSSLLNRFYWMWEKYPFETNEVCCQKTNIGFVDSIWELFGPLLKGIRSILISESVEKDPRQLCEIFVQHSVTRLVLVPSLLQLLIEEISLSKLSLPLKYCTVSGEAISFDLAKSFFKGLKNCILLNLYGSSEVAADVLYYEMNHATVDPLPFIPIGRPISNVKVYILDKFLRPVPQGVEGEIVVSGSCLAKGYLNNPELSKERFISIPSLQQSENDLFFRTGDIGRQLSDGIIEYIGRNDYQVKIRGYRIELGEIEAHFKAIPKSLFNLKDVVLLARRERLIAYLTSYDIIEESQKIEYIEEMRNYLKLRVSEYMTPNYFVFLDAFPLNSSGKIDRNLLPEPTRLNLNRASDPLQTPNERSIAIIWRKLLDFQVDDYIDRNDNFFLLGGHSILAIRLQSQLRKELNLEIPLDIIFDNPILKDLSSKVDQISSQYSHKLKPSLIARTSSTTPLPLSFAQQRLWFLDKLLENKSVYHITTMSKLTGVNIDLYEKAISTIIVRHASLRTVFRDNEGEGIQVVLKPEDAKFELNRIDLSNQSLREEVHLFYFSFFSSLFYFLYSFLIIVTMTRSLIF